jgi:hypothetical protein
VQALADLLDPFQEGRDKLPSSLANNAMAEALDVVLELRGHVRRSSGGRVAQRLPTELIALINSAAKTRPRAEKLVYMPSTVHSVRCPGDGVRRFGKMSRACHFRGRPHNFFLDVDNGFGAGKAPHEMGIVSL